MENKVKDRLLRSHRLRSPSLRLSEELNLRVLELMQSCLYPLRRELLMMMLLVNDDGGMYPYP